MKMRFLSVLCLTLALSACHDNSTPKGALESAYEALIKNDSATFKSLLSGSALAQFQGIAAQEGLKKDLSQYTNLKVSSAKLESSQSVGHMESVDTYVVQILNDGKAIYQGKTLCNVKREWQWTNPNCFGQPHGIPGHPDTYPVGCGPSQTHLETTQTCTVSQFKKL